jgi:hypothetical protein
MLGWKEKLPGKDKRNTTFTVDICIAGSQKYIIQFIGYGVGERVGRVVAERQVCW